MKRIRHGWQWKRNYLYTVSLTKEAGKWFQKAGIQEPEYRLTCRKWWEIFGVRDERMLPEGMGQYFLLEKTGWRGKTDNKKYKIKTKKFPRRNSIF